MPRKVKTRKYYRKGKTQKKSGTKFLNLFIFILGLVVVVYTFSFVKRLTQTEAVGSPEPVLVRIEVLNGCGVKGAAQKVGDFLREKRFQKVYFDVRGIENYTTSSVSKTVIWDRVGDVKLAQMVADELGIDDILQKPLKKNYEDVKVTLILGSDYHKIFQGQKP